MTTSNTGITTPLRPTEMAEAIATCLKAHRAPMLHGDPGIGKSELVRQAADLMFASEYGCEVADDYRIRDKKTGKYASSRPWFIDFRTALHDAVDLMGVPYVDHNLGPDRKPGVALTRFAIPDFLPRDKRGGVFFYDEINRGPIMTQNGAFSMVLDGSLGEYHLPPNWVCAAAVNDKDIGASKMSAALTRRFTHLDAVTNLDDVCRYAVKCNWEPVVVAFLRMRPALLNIFLATERVSPNPRAWEFISQIVAQGHANKRVEHALFAGNIGDEGAVEFSAFLRMYNSLPSIDAIMLNPKKAEVPTEPGVLYAISAALGRRANRENFERIITYLDRLPIEFGTFSVIDATNRDKDLTRHAAFTQWAVNHHELTQ